MWTNLKKISGGKKSVNLEYVIDSDSGAVLETPVEIMNALARRFFPQPFNVDAVSDVVHVSAPGSGTSRFEPDPPTDAEFPPFTEAEVKSSIFSNKPLGAVGPDLLPNQLFRKTSYFLTPVITRLMNTVMRLHHHPRSWKSATVISVPKTAQHNNQTCFLRPISLLCSLSKILERLVSVRLTYWAETKGILSPNQYGFRKQHDCESALLRFTTSVERSLESGDSCAAVALDLRSAFDTVQPRILMDRLGRMGAARTILSWLSSFTNDRRSILTVGGHSKEFATFSACPQGSNLSPILFIMFINPVLQLDLNPSPESLQESSGESIEGMVDEDESSYSGTEISIQAFADDLLMWSSGPNLASVQLCLQQSLDLVAQWIANAELKLNASKCSVTQMTRGRRSTGGMRLSISGEWLEEASCFKYLGIKIDSKLNWTQHINHIRLKSYKKLAVLRKLSGTVFGVAPEIMSRFIRMVVLPTMYYGCGVWCSVSQKPKTLVPLNRITRQCGLMISGCLRTSAYPAVYFLAGLYTPEIEINRRVYQLGLRLSRYSRLEELDYSEGRESLRQPTFCAQLRVEVNRLSKESGVETPSQQQRWSLMAFRPTQRKN